MPMALGTWIEKPPLLMKNHFRYCRLLGSRRADQDDALSRELPILLSERRIDVP